MLTRRAVLAAAPGAAAGREGNALPRGEIARLSARAERLLRGQGLRRGTVAERITALFADERWLYPDNDAGRDRAVADMNARLAALRPVLPRAFGDLPIPGATVRRMSAGDEAAGRGGYRAPEGYYVDLKAIRNRPAWTLPSVAFHETVPGHRMLPEGSSFNAEAWAIYAEGLAADLGAYQGDPLGELGYIHWRLFRLARMVADVGLMDGWTPERAVAEMRRIQGHDIAFVTVEADVARMARAPGSYFGQTMGALAIWIARPRAVADWPAYHRMVLS